MNTYTRRDLNLSLLSGLLTGLLVIGIAILQKICSPLIKTVCIPLTINQLWPLTIVTPILFVIGTWLANFFSKYLPVLAIFGRFVAVGLLNTALDFTILTGLIYLMGYREGETIKLILLNTVSFLTAVTNSYFWNRAWSFQARSQSRGKEFVQYIIVTLIGLVINDAMVAIGTAHFSTPLGFTSTNWVLTVKAAAVGISLFWNFIGYRFIVFRQTTTV